MRSNRLKIENLPRGIHIPLSKDKKDFRESSKESFRKEINNIIKKANNEIEEQDYKLIGELLNISKIGVVVEYEGKKWDLLDVFVYKNNFKMVDLILEMTFKKANPRKFQELLEKAIKIAEMNLYKKVGFLSYYSGRTSEDNEVKNIKEVISLLKSYRGKNIYEERKKSSDKDGKQEK